MKQLQYIIITVVCLLFTACNGYDWESYPASSVTKDFEIESGNMSAVITADNINSDFIQLKWSEIKSSDGSLVFYDMLFFNTEDFEAPFYVLHQYKNDVTLTYLDLEEIAKKAGIKNNQQGTVYWKIRASNGIDETIGNDYRSLTLTRPTRFNNTYPFDFTDNALEFSDNIGSSAEKLSFLFDNEENTDYEVNANSVSVTAKCRYPIILFGLGIAVNPDFKTIDKGAIKIESSVDGSDWSILRIEDQYKKSDTYTSYRTEAMYTSPKDGNWDYDNPKPTTNVVPGQYYRITIDNSENICLSDLQLLGSPYISKVRQMPEDIIYKYADMSTLVTNDGGLSGWKQEIRCLFDGFNDQPYTSNGGKVQLTFNFSTTQSATAKSYAIGVPYNPGVKNRNPKTWDLYGHPAGSTDPNEWVLLDSRKDFKFPDFENVYSTTMYFDIDPANYVSCDGYKFMVKENNGQNMLHMGEFLIFENPVKDQ